MRKKGKNREQRLQKLSIMSFSFLHPITGGVIAEKAKKIFYSFMTNTAGVTLLKTKFID